MNLKNMIAQSIGKNLASKDQTLASILDNTTRKNEEKKEGCRMKMPAMRWSKKPVAIALAAALILTASIITIATNFSKTVKLELSAVNQNDDSDVVLPGDTVTLTVKTSDQTGFKKGIVGMTMDIAYDNDKLEYTNETINSLLDPVFSVNANEADPGTITVLIYADDAESPLSAAGDGNLFSLDFTVKSDAAEGTCAFTPVSCNLADYTDDEEGFELVNVPPAPAAAITVAGPLTISTSVTNHAETGDPVYGGTVTGGGGAATGSDKVISITPDSGWFISSVKVDDTAIDLAGLDSSALTLNKANSYTFSDLDDDHSIEVTFEKIIAVMNGASIRLSDEAALRFVTVVSSQFLADLESKDADCSMGTLIIPRNLITSGSALTRDTEKVRDIARTMWQDDFFEHPEGYKVMTGVLSGIPSANYSRDLAGRAYIIVGEDTIYTDFEEASNVRSLAQVAYLASNDPEMQPLENYYTAAQIAKLTAYADAYLD